MDRPFFVRTWCLVILYLRDDDGRLSMGEIREVYKDILAEYPNCGGFMPVDKFMAEVKRIVSYCMIQKHFFENYNSCFESEVGGQGQDYEQVASAFS